MDERVLLPHFVEHEDFDARKQVVRPVVYDVDDPAEYASAARSAVGASSRALSIR